MELLFKSLLKNLTLGFIIKYNQSIMKQNIAVLVLTLFWGTGLIAQAPIVDYYNLLAAYDDDIKLHKITKEDGLWFSQSASSDKKVLATVDAKHDFLELKDKEQGGIFNLQLSLFKTTDGQVYVGLVKNHFDIFLHGEIHILKMEDGQWKDVTNETLPVLRYWDFMENKKKETNTATSSLEQHLEFGYQLSTNGRTAEAVMRTKRLEAKCADHTITEKNYCEDLKKIKYASIQLVWNARTGKFMIGDKK